MGQVGSLSVDAVHPQQRSDGSNSRRWVGPFLTGGNNCGHLEKHIISIVERVKKQILKDKQFRNKLSCQGSSV